MHTSAGRSRGDRAIDGEDQDITISPSGAVIDMEDVDDINLTEDDGDAPATAAAPDEDQSDGTPDDSNGDPNGDPNGDDGDEDGAAADRYLQSVTVNFGLSESPEHALSSCASKNASPSVVRRSARVLPAR